jgi:UDP-N-acetylglucosamine 1-carboxyvinyltransferase
MDRVRITGGVPLRGSVKVSGSKNSALPILFATLLTEETVELDRVPDLQDIRTSHALLQQMGVEVTTSRAGSWKYCAANVLSQEAPYDLVRKMRASVLVLGPLLARFGRAKVSLPGGCAIGARPINFHLAGLEKLGAQIQLEQGYVLASAKRLRGARVVFDFPSVGATENLMMAAALAQGESVLENCAKEPEIVDLARLLSAMGTQIEGAGTERILIQGRDRLSAARHSIIGDRIEAGTYLAAAMTTRGSVRVEGVEPEFLESVLVKLEEAGAAVTRSKDAIEIHSPARPRAVDFCTQPFPGFPTDMQAQLMAVLCLADGTSTIEETIFENRYMHVPELTRLGADITIKGNTAIIRGKSRFIGAPLMATDLRASASLVIAGLAAEGETIVNRIYHLDRGYERMEEKLRSLGAQIERLKG